MKWLTLVINSPMPYTSRFLLSLTECLGVLLATKPSRIPSGGQHRMDFILLHTSNTLVVMPTLIKHQWISPEKAIRLMEWAGTEHEYGVFMARLALCGLNRIGKTASVGFSMLGVISAMRVSSNR